MFNLNEWGVAGSLSVTISLLWIGSIVIAELWKYAWAWIDDSKPAKRNFIINKIGCLSKSKWVYPVYNCGEKDEKNPDKRGDIFGYSKDENHNETSCHKLEEGRNRDYVYAHSGRHNDSFNNRIIIIPLTVAIPFLFVILIKFYITCMVIGSLVLTAYLSRFTRRLSKKYKTHSEDKSIHITKEESSKE